jgi:hypothetical protein
METLQWAIGILVVILMGIMGFFATQLSAHVAECRQLLARLEGTSRDVERMKEDIGTHDRGMRGAIHKMGNVITEHEMRVATLERK